MLNHSNTIKESAPLLPGADTKSECSEAITSPLTPITKISPSSTVVRLQRREGNSLSALPYTQPPSTSSATSSEVVISGMMDESKLAPIIDLNDKKSDEQKDEKQKNETTMVEAKENSNDLTYTQALKDLVKYAAPYAGSSFIVIGGNFVGVIIISKLGAQALAASNLASSIQNWLTSTMGATLASASIVAGRKIGNKEPHEVGHVLHQGWFFTWILSVPSVTLVLLSKQILTSIGQNPEIVDLTRQFFNGYAWGLPAMYMLSCNRRIALATSNASVGFFFDIFYQALDTALSYGLVFGDFYLPQLGFAGIGYSNSITAWTTLTLSTLYLCCSDRFRPYNLTKFRRENFFSGFKQFVKIGLPIGAKVGGELAALLAASLMIGAMGPDQQAAQEASFQYIFVLSTPMFSIMDAVGTLASRAIGAKNISNAKKIGNVGIALSAAISTTGIILFVSMPDILLGAFVNTSDPENQQIVSTARTLMLINGLTQLADSIRNTASGGLSGFYDTLKPTLIILATQAAINIPLSYVLGFPLNMEAIGVMTARGISIAVGASLLLHRWIKTDNVVQTSNQQPNAGNQSAADSKSAEKDSKSEAKKQPSRWLSCANFFNSKTSPKNALESSSSKSTAENQSSAPFLPPPSSPRRSACDRCVIS